MMKRSLLLGCISLFVVAVFAQEDPVLMRVNGREILRSEFEYAYRRYAERSNAQTFVQKSMRHFSLNQS